MAIRENLQASEKSNRPSITLELPQVGCECAMIGQRLKCILSSSEVKPRTDGSFAEMAERRVPEVMHQSCGRGNILDVLDSGADFVSCFVWQMDINLSRWIRDSLYQPPRHARDFQRVCQAGSDKVIRIERKDLSFVL